MNIRMMRFQHTDSYLMEAYWKLKFEVFSEELGWRLPTSRPGSVAEDKFDPTGLFVGAVSPPLLGVVRGICMADAIPYYSMIAHHLRGHGTCFKINSTATITSLAVNPSYRGKKLVETRWGQVTIAEAIVKDLFGWLENNGVCNIIANVSLTRAVYFFRKLGFRVIDPVFRQRNHPYPIMNMAVCLAKGSDDASEYLVKREAQILRTECFDRYVYQHS